MDLLCKLCDRLIMENEYKESEHKDYLDTLRKKMMKVYIINILIMILT